ncbi:Rha family transcriptional regulator [Serratia fonticola]
MAKKTEIVIGGVPMMGSKEIAKLTKKTVGNVNADIWSMLDQLYNINKDDWNFNHHKNQQIKIVDGVIAVIDGRGYVSEFLLDRRHSEILITGYDVKRRAAVIDRWFALESGQAKPITAPADAMQLLNDPTTLRSLLMNFSGDNERLIGENQQLASTVESLEKHFTKGMTIPAFCKCLNGVNINKMMWWAFERNWIFNEQRDPEKSARWRVASYARDTYLTEEETEVKPHGKDAFTKKTPVLLEKGCHRLYALYMKGELPMKATWNGEYNHDKAAYTPEENQ